MNTLLACMAISRWAVRAPSPLLQCAFWCNTLAVMSLGSRLVVDEALAIPDENLTLEEEPCRLEVRSSSNYYMSMMRQFCEQEGIPMDLPYKKLKEVSKQTLSMGQRRTQLQILPLMSKRHGQSMVFEGSLPIWNAATAIRVSTMPRSHAPVHGRHICPACRGQRLNPTALSVRWGPQYRPGHQLSISDTLAHFKSLTFGLNR